MKPFEKLMLGTIVVCMVLIGAASNAHAAIWWLSRFPWSW